MISADTLTYFGKTLLRQPSRGYAGKSKPMVSKYAAMESGQGGGENAGVRENRQFSVIIEISKIVFFQNSLH